MVWKFYSSSWYCSKSKSKFSNKWYKTLCSCCKISTQENIKLLKQIESSFKRTINWNKYLSQTTNQAQNIYLDYLIDSSFQGVNRLSILSFKDDDGRESHKQHYLLTVEIKDYVIINEMFLINLKTYDKVRKIAAGQGDDYTTGCLLDYPYLKKYYKL